MKFAVFDIDGTVIRWQLFHAIVQELVKRGAVAEGDVDRIRQARMTWKKRDSDQSFEEYERLLIEVYRSVIDGLSQAVFDEVVEVVFETYRDQVYTYTRDLIASLKGQGYLLFAISGSHQEIVSKLGQYYGFDEAVGVQHEVVDGLYTDRTLVEPYHRKGEVLQELVERHGADWEGSVAVGDTLADVAMLRLVEQPIAFNPNKGLLEVAMEEGWRVVVERKNVVYRLEADAWSLESRA